MHKTILDLLRAPRSQQSASTLVSMAGTLLNENTNSTIPASDSGTTTQQTVYYIFLVLIILGVGGVIYGFLPKNKSSDEKKEETKPKDYGSTATTEQLTERMPSINSASTIRTTPIPTTPPSSPRSPSPTRV